MRTGRRQEMCEMEVLAGGAGGQLRGWRGRVKWKLEITMMAMMAMMAVILAACSENLAASSHQITKQQRRSTT